MRWYKSWNGGKIPTNFMIWVHKPGQEGMLSEILAINVGMNYVDCGFIPTTKLKVRKIFGINHWGIGKYQNS